MRLFLYYAFHSVINTIKKMFRTWIAIILLVVAVGVVFGLVAGGIGSLIENKIADNEEEQIEEVVEEESEGIGFSFTAFFEEAEFTKSDIVDLVASLAMLFIFATSFLSSKSTGNLFKPADVVMLFSAPMKPQSVMLFRVLTSMGMMLLVGFYMLFQMPDLIMNMGFSVGAAISMIVAYMMIMLFATLFQVTFYTVFSKVDVLRKNMYTVLAGIYILIGFGLIAYMKITNQTIINAALHYFTGKKTFWVPFWGWLRAFCYYSVEGQFGKAYLFFAMIVAGIAVLITVIWKMDADFYEDAIASADKYAAKLENAKMAGTSGTVKRGKDRRANLQREGFDKGYGASVFLHKALYNRHRFAKLGVATTTMLIYIGISLLVSLLCREITAFNPFFIVGGVFTLAVFYRSLGNPMEEDTSREFFIMIPEKMIKKLFFSYIGGMTNTLLDLVVPFVIAAVILKADVFMVVGWLLFVLSVDYFGTAVGTFISVSVPYKDGASIKQVIQVLFVYFGIMPAAVCIILGVVFEKVLLFSIIAASFDILAGSLFFFLIPLFLEGGNR